MGIVGEVFNEKVRKQIEDREALLADAGNLSHSKNYLQFQNSNSWLRLASAVDLKAPAPGDIIPQRRQEFEDRVAELTQRIGVQPGSDLAKKLVLYGGTQQFVPTGDSGTFIPKAGIDRNTSNQFITSGAYGFGTVNFGYKPMPGIQSAKITYYNNGALAKADIEILCHSPEQLDMLELLYLRPGYSILLEWGHNTYVGSDGAVTQFDLSTTTKPFVNFFKDGTTADGMASTIVSEREKHAFNYDGFYGIITNFNWSFNPDASYTVTLKAITKGAVIESLKVNTAASKGPQIDSGDSDVSEDESKQPIAKIYKRKEESLLFYKLTQLAEAFATTTRGATALVENFNAHQSALYGKKLDVFKVLTSTILDEIFEDSFKTTTGDVLKIRYKVEEDDQAEFGDYQHYIKLGTFLKLLETYCLIYTDKGKPVFKFDTDNTPMFTFPGHFSANPGVCLIPPYMFVNNVGVDPADMSENRVTFSYIPGPSFYITGMGAGVNNRATPFRSGDKLFCGNLMQVFINFNEIVKQVLAKEDNEGNVKLVDMLQGILSEVANVLGGVNKFEVKFDEDTNSITLYDKSAHGCGVAVNEKQKITKFKPYGVTTTKGSIIRDLRFQSELTNEFASMIAIGAQANGNQIGINSTAYSEFNIGLIDRIIPAKNTTKEKQQKETPEERFRRALEVMQPLIQEMYTVNWQDPNGVNVTNLYDLKLSSESVNTLMSLNTTYAKYIVGFLTDVEKALASPFFIPFNLRATLTGISGIKIFQKYNIEQEILPYSYRNKINFLIKNLTHTISNNRWTTELESLTVPEYMQTGEKWTPKMQVLASPVAAQANNVGGAAKTLGPVGYNVREVWVTSKKPKNQIYIHHTAGGPSIEANLRTWEQITTYRQSTHWIIGPTTAEHIFDDNYWAYHLGIPSATFTAIPVPYKNLNTTSLSVELTSYGWLKKTSNGTFLTYVDSEVPASQAVQPVDANGIPLRNGYRGYAYYQEYTDYQIDFLENLLYTWVQGKTSDGLVGGTSTDLPGDTIIYKFSYDDLFPPADVKKLSKNALKGKPGIYTHNSVRSDKTDVAPTPKMVAMLKRLEARLSTAGDRPQGVYLKAAAELKKFFVGQTTQLEEIAAQDLILRVVQNRQDWSSLSAAYGTDQDGYGLKSRIEYEYNGTFTGNRDILRRLNTEFAERKVGYTGAFFIIT